MDDSHDLKPTPIRRYHQVPYPDSHHETQRMPDTAQSRPPHPNTMGDDYPNAEELDRYQSYLNVYRRHNTNPTPYIRNRQLLDFSSYLNMMENESRMDAAPNHHYPPHPKITNTMLHDSSTSNNLNQSSKNLYKKHGISPTPYYLGIQDLPDVNPDSSYDDNQSRAADLEQPYADPKPKFTRWRPLPSSSKACKDAGSLGCVLLPISGTKVPFSLPGSVNHGGMGSRGNGRQQKVRFGDVLQIPDVK